MDLAGMLMNIQDFYTSERKGLSFELFPPKTKKGELNLFRHLNKLTEFQPDYVTCTYGAGGSTQAKTLELVSKVKSEFNLPVASHLTVVGSTVDDLKTYLGAARKKGIDYIVALRGDPPLGESAFRAAEGGLSHANDLVALIRGEFPEFGIAVAGYPEKHREAVSLDVDLDHLKRKVDSGSDIIITQLFYENGDFYHFVDKCRGLGIEVPIVPGILPVVNLSQIKRITSLCDAKLPTDFQEQLENAQSDEQQLEIGIDYATRQVDDLISNGACGVHFYVLNKSESASKVLDALNFNR